LHPQWAHFVERPFPTEEAQELLTSAAPESTPARIAAVSIVGVRSLLETLPAVKRTASNAKHPRRSELTFEHGERGGPSNPCYSL